MCASCRLLCLFCFGCAVCARTRVLADGAVDGFPPSHFSSSSCCLVSLSVSQAPIEDDFYGRGLMAAGLPASVITAWCDDPQVTFQGKKGSLFDYLEDLDADTVLLRARQIS